MNSDFKDLLRWFAKHRVRYLLVGGYAVIHYAQPRFTKDLDVWLQPTAANARRVMLAFRDFGIPLIDVTEADFATESFQYMVGRAPVLFDFLTSLPPLKFPHCWKHRKTDDQDGIPVHYLPKSELIRAKQSAGRAVDLADLEELRRADQLPKR